MTNKTIAPVEQANNTETVEFSESDVIGVFEQQNYREPFDRLLHSNEPIATTVLTIAYFTRPEYANGGIPPEGLPPEHPLYKRIVDTDVASLPEDQQYVFQVLQGAIVSEAEGVPAIIDKPLLVGALIPSLIDELSPRASGSALRYYEYMARGGASMRSVNEIDSRILAAVGMKLEDSDPEDLQAVILGLKALSIFKNHRNGDSGTDPSRLNAFEQMEARMIEDQMILLLTERLSAITGEKPESVRAYLSQSRINGLAHAEKGFSHTPHELSEIIKTYAQDDLKSILEESRFAENVRSALHQHPENALLIVDLMKNESVQDLLRHELIASQAVDLILNDPENALAVVQALSDPELSKYLDDPKFAFAAYHAVIRNIESAPDIIKALKTPSLDEVLALEHGKELFSVIIGNPTQANDIVRIVLSDDFARLYSQNHGLYSIMLSDSVKTEAVMSAMSTPNMQALLALEPLREKLCEILNTNPAMAKQYEGLAQIKGLETALSNFEFSNLVAIALLERPTEADSIISAINREDLAGYLSNSFISIYIVRHLLANPENAGDVAKMLASPEAQSLLRLITGEGILANFSGTYIPKLLERKDPDAIMKEITGVIDKTFPTYYRQTEKRYQQALKKGQPALPYKQEISALFRQATEIIHDKNLFGILTRLQAGNTDELEALRAVDTLKKLQVRAEDYVEFTTLEDINRYVVKEFLVINPEVEINDEAINIITAELGTLTPISIYSAKHRHSEGHRQTINDMIVAIAKGKYVEWRLGDGTESGMGEMVNAGYLPSGLTLPVYQAWREQISVEGSDKAGAEADDAARSIRSTIERGIPDLLSHNLAARFSELDVVTARDELDQAIANVRAVHKLRSAVDNEAAIHLALEEMPEALRVEVQIVLGDDARLQKIIQKVELAQKESDLIYLLHRLKSISTTEVSTGQLQLQPGKAPQKINTILEKLSKMANEEAKPVIENLGKLWNSFRSETGRLQSYTALDTIDARTTIEIGETPVRSCQDYATGSMNAGLIGYTDPGVKIITVANSEGNLVARSVLRLLQTSNGDPVLMMEPIYRSVISSSVGKTAVNVALQKARAMGVRLFVSSNALPDAKELSLSANVSQADQLYVRSLRAPAVYSDSGHGLQYGTLSIDGAYEVSTD